MNARGLHHAVTACSYAAEQHLYKGGGGRVSYSDPNYVSIIACSTILRMVWATDHMFFEGPIKFQSLRDVIKVITMSGHELVIFLASERLVYQGLRPEQRLTIHSFMKGNDCLDHW